MNALGWSAAERRTAALLAAAIAGLHVFGFGLLLAAASRHYNLGSEGVFGVGLGLTAYTLGLRHAFDADHIAAIDNVTRRFTGEGERPLSVGFWFSLGHSTVVFALGALVVVGVRGLDGAVSDDASLLHTVTGLIGPVVSGTFLLLVGAANLVVLVGMLRGFRAARGGEPDGAGTGDRPLQGGAMSRVFGRATRTVSRPWHMYPLGFLFGLGFDTATEVALLVLAGAGAADGLPFYAILSLPLLFAAGMSLFDTLDGAVMAHAYRWTTSRPAGRVYYNAAITGLSVAFAVGIGTTELISVLGNGLAAS